MKNRILLLVTLLLMCALIPLQRATATLSAAAVGVSSKTTDTDGTGNITYTMRITNSGSGTISALISISAKSPSTFAPTISRTLAAISRDGGTANVTLTVPRSEISSIGIYSATVKVENISVLTDTAQVTFTTTVTAPTTTPPAAAYAITLNGVGSLRKSTSIIDAGDITYTFRVTNAGNRSDQVTLTVTGDVGTATLDQSSVTLDLNAHIDVTLTIPRAELTTGNKAYLVTVTATSQNDNTATSSLTTRTFVAPIERYSVILQPVGSFSKTTTTEDTEDITYTLRVTNAGNRSDQVILTVSSRDVSTATLDQSSVTLDPAAHIDVTLTIPRAELTTGNKTYRVTVLASSINSSAAINSRTTITVVRFPTQTDPTVFPPTQTDPTVFPPIQTDPTGSTDPSQSTYQVVLSEYMFEAGVGETNLPQWIEVYNNSSSEVNLRGWKLQWESLKPSPLDLTITFNSDFRIPPQQARLIVTALGRHSGSGNLSDDDVYQSSLLHEAGLAQEMTVSRFQDISGGGFSLKLTNSTDVVVDHIGTLSGDKKRWKLPVTLIEGVRSSLIRRFDAGVPRAGTEKRGWRLAFDAKRLVIGLYYGSPHDLGTPGYRRGKPLPVELSQFSAKFVKDEVVINWTTESELDNAGFNIFRSTSRTKNFQRINPKLIQGAGTTGQRNSYQFIDKTAKPDVLYYYRLEDIDLSGTRGILTTYRLRGVITPTGKDITTWGTLKDDR